jgi:hypothetical protein
MVMNEKGLWYQKACPSGKYCPASGTAAPATISEGFYSAEGATSDSVDKCEDGYTCK